MSCRAFLIPIALLIGCPTIVVGGEPLSFNRDIRPLLSDACFFCHGPDAGHRAADLRLDVEADAKDYAIVPGDLESEFIARITSDDPELRMPPPESGKVLAADQVALLKRWVSEGARYETHWAYVPPRAVPVPTLDSTWPRGYIDQFIFEQHQRQQLQPAPEADRRSLIRRVTFDLTGLPADPAEVESFVQDPSPVAYERVVDRLLASPAYGERMAAYWLDLVRFADTVGYHGDQDHNISPYRDYVIDSLCDDKPLDQFTREQLAGDLLPDPTIEQRIATAYNRLLQTSHEGGVQPQEYLTIYAADRIRNVSNVWMGATVGCAQCHDHKYDPYTAKDFYALSAMFADIDEAAHFSNGTNELPTRRDPEIAVLSRAERQWRAKLEAAITAAADDPPRRAELESQRARLQQQQRLVMVTRSIAPREIRLLPRGDWLDDSGPVVEPAIPEFLGDLDIEGRRATRLDLANWLVDPQDGVGMLTARVFANRFWYLLMGRGISPSLDDFGGQGQPPSHPELLDRLAIDFVQDRWSIKRSLRRIVLSRTYRQSSVVPADQLRQDPQNRWFARQSRYRLPAEMVRDNALSISGMLVHRVGGASVKPEQPSGYYRHLNFPQRVYQADTGAQQYRRGVYVHWQRQFLHPMLKATDAPSREECTAARPRSNTPLEALVMLNDPTMVTAATALARQLLAEPGHSDEQRIADGFARCVARPPTPTEAAAISELLQQERHYFGDHETQARALLGSEAASASEPAELAAWTSVARALLNLYETVSRN